MSFDGISNWPPEWKWTFGGDNNHPVGEIGELEDSQQSSVDPGVCFLTISHDGSTYVGRLQFKGFVSSSVNYWRAITVDRSRKLEE
jgi:hypothetical protein